MLDVEIKFSIVVCIYKFTRDFYFVYLFICNISCATIHKTIHKIGEESDMINSIHKTIHALLSYGLEYSILLVLDIVPIECNSECWRTFYLHLHNLQEAASALPRFI